MIVGAHGNASGGQTFRRRSVEWVRSRLRSIPASVFPDLNSCVLCSHPGEQPRQVSPNALGSSFGDTNQLFEYAATGSPL